jgi:hypothetical protein
MAGWLNWVSQKILERMERPKSASDAVAAQPLHWTRADKPFGEMDSSERREFATKIAEGAFTNLNLESAEASASESRFGRFWNSDSALAVIAVTLITLLIFFNWEKVPVVGTNAKALTHVKLACGDKNLQINERIIQASWAANLDEKWQPLAEAYRGLELHSLILKEFYSVNFPEATNDLTRESARQIRVSTSTIYQTCTAALRKN